MPSFEVSFVDLFIIALCAGHVKEKGGIKKNEPQYGSLVFGYGYNSIGCGIGRCRQSGDKKARSICIGRLAGFSGNKKSPQVYINTMW